MSYWEEYEGGYMGYLNKKQESEINRRYRVNCFQREFERVKNMRMSKPFSARYGGQFCVICGFDVEEGDEVLFLEDELAHAEEAYEKYGEPLKQVKVFTFDPDDFE